MCKTEKRRMKMTLTMATIQMSMMKLALLNLLFNYSSKYSAGDLLKIHRFVISLVPGAQPGWVLGVWKPLPFQQKNENALFAVPSLYQFIRLKRHGSKSLTPFLMV